MSGVTRSAAVIVQSESIAARQFMFHPTDGGSMTRLRWNNPPRDLTGAGWSPDDSIATKGKKRTKRKKQTATKTAAEIIQSRILQPQKKPRPSQTIAARARAMLDKHGVAEAIGYVVGKCDLNEGLAASVITHLAEHPEHDRLKRSVELRMQAIRAGIL
jgi:hypothetical protein